MSQAKKEFSSFEDFTNLYEVQKTLRFELKPVGKTLEFLEKNEVFKKDEKIAEAYQEIKPIFDDLHRKFVAEALSGDRIDVNALRGFADEYAQYRTDPKKNKKLLENAEKKLYKNLAKSFDVVGELWKERYSGKTYRTYEGKEKKIKLTSKGYKILTDAPIFGVLSIEYPEHSQLFGLFDKFSTYFSGFNETRENFYKDDGTSTAVVTRVVDNFEKFLENKVLFKRHLELTGLDLTEEEKTTVDNVDAYAGYFLQKDIEKYNLIVGSLNKRMKMLRDAQGKDVKKADYPLLKTIYDQILGGKKKVFIEMIENDKEAREEIDVLIDVTRTRFALIRDLVHRLQNCEFNEDLGSIYLTNRAINTVSRRWMNDGVSFERALPQKGKASKEDDAPKVACFVSLQEVKSALEKMEGDVFKEKYRGIRGDVQNPFELFVLILRNEFNLLFDGWTTESGEKNKGFNEATADLEKILSTEKNVRSKNCKPFVKEYLDSGLRIFQLAKYFSLDVREKKGVERPSQISSDFYNGYDDYAKDFFFAGKYDLFRNYLSKKIGDDANKVKLNFENGMLLNGWDRDKEVDYQGFIFRDEKSLFLGITGAKDARLFQKEGDSLDEGSVFSKMHYKQLNNIFRQLPRIAFSDKAIKKYGIGDELLKIKDEFDDFQESKKGLEKGLIKDFDSEKLQKLIGYYKQYLLAEYASKFDIKEVCNREYHKLNDFYKAIEDKTYSVKWVGISKAFIDKAIDDGQLYLFEIHNKDSNLKDGKEKTGKKNIHTMYWDALFSSENLKNPIIKLSGGAEMFLRRGMLDELKKLKDNNGKEFIEHKRYAEDKMFFHVPVVLNRSGEDVSTYSHNLHVREYLSENDDACVIGIDRGEKHLLYYSVINQRGEILDQGSLNKISLTDSASGEVKVVDYYQKLVDCEKQRKIDRQSWEPARKIKDLKAGYIAQAVHAICELIKKHYAIVVLEDLNMGFKQVRGGVERSVYQQFEHALINKLGYLVFKDKKPEESGGVFHGYQLTAPFESFEKLNKQTGFLFYTQADYTSITDPLTGFRKNVYISNSAPIGSDDSDKKSDRGLTLRRIFSDKVIIGWDDTMSGWDGTVGSYCFTYNQKDFGNDKKNIVPSKEWRVYANVPRMKRFNRDGYWHAELVNPNKMLEELFRTWGIESPHGDVYEAIHIADKEGRLKGKKMFDGNEREFWKSLIYIFNLILTLRNSSSQQYVKDEKTGQYSTVGEEVDFISSPIEPFFCTAFEKEGEIHRARLDAIASRITGPERERIITEFNGDANGAYNIARKGLMIIGAIRENTEKPELFISKLDWDKFTQKPI